MWSRAFISLKTESNVTLAFVPDFWSSKYLLFALDSGFANMNIFNMAFGNTRVPISRPSITSPLEGCAELLVFPTSNPANSLCFINIISLILGNFATTPT
ncbi:hypothetical protein AX774_g4695 [Zancudomyces culisetae]|uniref:Uncharacterized protein n=1 Tax=Zancudomyces culisetae TaxID=1213189 RepID=A0A1R1PLU4_ZANCU|nr:hypothetical protein AX774_g5579 [Zancudomyces culisetae]OMH81842.1 hypothetical protein AX774_g4695 [Zancudomyces culisetae]|eukprot:OMH80977.1 hypothetical protein AX774_g5579 [Zancudomyces culisetae]